MQPVKPAIETAGIIVLLIAPFVLTFYGAWGAANQRGRQEQNSCFVRAAGYNVAICAGIFALQVVNLVLHEKPGDSAGLTIIFLPAYVAFVLVLQACYFTVLRLLFKARR